MPSWGARWQLRGLKGLLWTPFPKGRMPSNRVSLYLVLGSVGGMGYCYQVRL
jgi:hypothetical protein